MYRPILSVCFLLCAIVPVRAQKPQEKKDDKQVKLQEVLVEANKKPVHLNSVSRKLESAVLREQAGQSLSKLLERISGLSSIQSGVAQAKPVIHGMHGNRILIINNGARQTGQQWSEAHAPEIDISGSSEVYVVKGAESVRYGSEALGGVIVLEQAPLLYGYTDSLSGRANVQYASNGKRISGNALANWRLSALPNWAFRGQLSIRNNGDYSTANYLLNNTGGRNYAGLLGAGYSRGRLRVEGYLSHYYELQGIMLASNLGSVKDLREVIDRGQPIVFTPWSRVIDYPRERVYHTNLSIKATYKLPNWGMLRYQFTYQYDHRQEFKIRRNNNSHIPEMDLKLHSQQHQIRWEHRYHDRWQTELGSLLQYTNNFSVPDNGMVPVIPNYVEHVWGVYGIQKFHADNWGIEAGLRGDGQRTKAAGYDYGGSQYGGTRRFANITYSLGGHYRVARGMTLKSNFGVAWRAPHVHELYSNGHDHGSAAYVEGNSSLQSEQSYKWITSMNYRNAWLSVNLDGYLQWVNNYIYDEPQMNPDGSPKFITLMSGHYPRFLFKQTNAFFRGVDLEVELNPLLWLSYELRTALIYANEMRTGHYLPYIPPVRVDHGLSFKFAKFLGRYNMSLKLEHRYVSKQTRFEPTKDLIPYTPDAYHLLGAELNIECNKNLTVKLSGDNLLNKEYKEYTNRARYYSHDLGRDLRLGLSLKL